MMMVTLAFVLHGDSHAFLLVCWGSANKFCPYASAHLKSSTGATSVMSYAHIHDEWESAWDGAKYSRGREDLRHTPITL